MNQSDLNRKFNTDLKTKKDVFEYTKNYHPDIYANTNSGDELVQFTNIMGNQQYRNRILFGYYYDILSNSTNTNAPPSKLA